MIAQNDEEFLKMLEKDHSDVDWANLPPIDEGETYWVIEGMQHRRWEWLARPDKPAHEWKDKIGFGLAEEFKTKEEAEAYLESMKTNPLWCEEHLERDDRLMPDGSPSPKPSLKYLGPVIFDSPHERGRTSVRERKRTTELQVLHFFKECLDRIKSGEKVFPIYLP